MDATRLWQVAALSVGHNRKGPGSGTARLHDDHGRPYSLGYTTPARFHDDSLYPLIVYLHGGVRGASDSKGERAYDMLLPLRDSIPLFLASPTATATAPWWSPSGLKRILQTVRFMTLHFPVDERRIILAGVSDGAAGCYAVASTMPAPFAGFWAISGFGAMLPSVGIPLVPGNLMQRPIYNVQGGKDTYYRFEEVNQFLDYLVEQGVGVIRKVYPEQGHGFDYREKEYGKLTELVRSWRTPSRPDAISWRWIKGFPARPDNLVSWQLSDGDAGLPGVNAYLRKGRLAIRSVGVESFVFLSERLEQPPAVVANGVAQQRAQDLSEETKWVLKAIQSQCSPVPPRRCLYRVIISN